jgi:hypothetical protein
MSSWTSVSPCLKKDLVALNLTFFHALIVVSWISLLWHVFFVFLIIKFLNVVQLLAAPNIAVNFPFFRVVDDQRSNVFDVDHATGTPLAL